MKPDGISRDQVLKQLAEITNNTYPNIYFVPKK